MRHSLSLVLVTCLLSANAQDTAPLVTIARKGQAGLTKIHANVSINDSGAVALPGETAAGKTAFVGNGTALWTVLKPGSGETGSMVRERVHLNNLDQVLMLRGTFLIQSDPVIQWVPIIGPIVVSPGSIDTHDFLQFWNADGSGSPRTMANAFTHAEYDLVTYPTRKMGLFWRLGPEFCANNQGQVAFVADQGQESSPSYVLVTRETTNSYVTLPVWSGIQPMLADDGTIVFQDGPSASGAIFTLDYLMSANGVQLIAAPSMGFTALGRAPGISDDGRYVAFYGDLSKDGASLWGTQPGPGIFLHDRNNPNRPLVRVAGLAAQECLWGLSEFQANTRVGVNAQAEAGGEVLVVFTASDHRGKGVFLGRYHPGGQAGGQVAAIAHAGESLNGLGPFTSFALYDPINTHAQIAFWAGGDSEAVFRAEAPPKVPVILVHGWRGNPATWNDLTKSLTTNGIDFVALDYSPGTDNPQHEAPKLAKLVAEYRQTHAYQGPFDLVCHSMGALVSRWYMEHDGGGENIRQWIGIGPVNQGAALADYEDYLGILAWLGSTVVADLRGEGAITQMQTDSDTVSTLNRAARVPGVIYRVMAGYNGCAWPANWHEGTCTCELSEEFRHPFLNRGKTLARITDERGVVHPHAWTYFGDSLVAWVQSQLPGVANVDAFPNVGHNSLQHHPGVIKRVVTYLLDPCTPSLNNGPSTADLLRDTDVQVVGAGNGGVVTVGERRVHSFPVDGSVQRLSVLLAYPGSRLELELASPSGKIMVPGQPPVVGHSEANGAVWYSVEAPEAGTWEARLTAVDVPASGEPYHLDVRLSTTTRLSVSLPNEGEPIQVGQAVPVRATFVEAETPVQGGTVVVRVTAPDGRQEVLSLHDDGAHADLAAGDGVFGATIQVAQDGRYELAFQGTAGLVQRIETLTLVVASGSTTPHLLIHILDGIVTLRWPVTPGQFVLESCTDLVPGGWGIENATPHAGTDNSWEVTLPLDHQRFFRLSAR